MNRHSITGPLILIGAGLLFLMHNLTPGFSVAALVRSYWPFAVIVVGVLGLVEVLFHASRGNPIPPRPISSGVWVFVVIFAVSLWGYRSHRYQFGRFETGGVSLLGTNYEYEVNASSGETGIKRIIFENLKGNLSVKGGDSDSVAVTGHRTVRAFNRGDADRANASSIRLDRQGDSLVIHDDVRERTRSLDITADLDITVPRGVSVEARDRAGDVAVDGIEGSVDVLNSRGDVRLNNVGKDVKIETRRSSLIHASNIKGNVEVQGKGDDLQFENVDGQVTINGSYSGTLEFKAIAKTMHFESDRTDFRVEAIPGSITLDLGDLVMKRVTGPVRFQTRTRDVVIEDVTGSLEIMVDRGDVQVTPGKVIPDMDIHTRNGNIDLALPEKAAFELRATAEQGEIENDYGATLTTETSGRTASAHGLMGKGPKIVAVTDRGTVSIKKS